jgi:hypothetical protein
VPWNFPGTNYIDIYGASQPNGIYTFTSTQVNTTNLMGNFTNIPGNESGQWGSAYTLVFQDNVNTNLYWPTNGVPVEAYSDGTATNLVLTAPITVSNGWRVFMSGQNAYQQLQLTVASNTLITGNYDYFNKAVTWNSNGVQTIPVSLVYTNGAPAWWGTNSWPAIDPAAPTVTMIPAQETYLGIPTGGGGGPHGGQASTTTFRGTAGSTITIQGTPGATTTLQGL